MPLFTKRKASPVLHLFSSDLRPLYLQDCLDLLGLPEGATQRFRYDRRWVWQGAKASSHEAERLWTRLAKAGTDVLVYFAATTKLRYSDTVFVPLRWGRITRSFVEGNIFVVDFELGQYVDPKSHLLDRASNLLEDDDFVASDAGSPKFERRSEAVIISTATICENLKGFHPAVGGQEKSYGGTFSAVVTSEPTAITMSASDSQSVAFERLVTVMHDLVGVQKRGSGYEGRVKAFFRVLGIVDPKGRLLTMRDGKYRVRGGLHYELRTMHLNLAGIQPDLVCVDVPRTITVDGPSKLQVSGKYDVREFRFTTEPKENKVIGIIGVSNSLFDAPEYAANSAPLRVAIRVPVATIPRKSLTLLNLVVTVGTGLVASGLALNALNGVLISPPKTEALYWDISSVVLWLFPHGYLAIAWGVILPALASGLVGSLIAAAAVFRRRLGLAEK